MHLHARTVTIGHRELDRLRKFASMSVLPGSRISYRESRARGTNQLRTEGGARAERIS